MSAGAGPKPGLLRGRRSAVRDETLEVSGTRACHCPVPIRTAGSPAGLAHGTGADGPTGSSRDRSSRGPRGTGDRTAVDPSPCSRKLAAPHSPLPGRPQSWPPAAAQHRVLALPLGLCPPAPARESRPRELRARWHLVRLPRPPPRRWPATATQTDGGRQPRVFTLSGLDLGIPKTLRAFNG